MKNISILGCGWLGKPLAVSLMKKEFSVKGSTTTLSKIEELESVNIIPFLVDVSLDENIDEFLNSDVLIIAITSKSEADFKRMLSKIEKSTIQYILFISSTSVYEKGNKEITEEDEIIDSPLANIENLFRSNNNFKTTIIRFAGLFGGDRHPGNWFKKGRKIPQPNGFVNMIHQDDCIAIIEEIICQKKWNTTFNACSNHHPTRKEFYIKAKESKGFEPPIFEENENFEWKIINSKKVQKVLDYTFMHDDLLSI